MATESLLTGAMREYLRDEKEDISTDYENTLLNRMRDRIAWGMSDLSLIEKNIDKVDPVKSVMRFSPDQNEVSGGESTRKDWRQQNARESILGGLTFLMRLSQAFKYGPANWENWLESAYEKTNPGSYAKVKFDVIPDFDLDELESIFDGEHEGRDRHDLRNVELEALHHHGRISLAEYAEHAEIPETV